MNGTVLDFIARHRVCSLTTLLPDGSPHAAALHYSNSDKPLTLYFSTERMSRKCQGLLNGEIVKGSVVVGFSEEEWITLQMDGIVNAVTDPTELTNIYLLHYTKHPQSEKYKNDPDTIFLAFTPRWWRYTNYKTSPLTIMSSEQ